MGWLIFLLQLNYNQQILTISSRIGGLSKPYLINLSVARSNSEILSSVLENHIFSTYFYAQFIFMLASCDSLNWKLQYYEFENSIHPRIVYLLLITIRLSIIQGLLYYIETRYWVHQTTQGNVCKTSHKLLWDSSISQYEFYGWFVNSSMWRVLNAKHLDGFNKTASNSTVWIFQISQSSILFNKCFPKVQIHGHFKFFQ